MTLVIIFTALLLIGFLIYRQDTKQFILSIDTIDWGVTFSEKMSQDFGLDWRETYSAIVHDLKPQGIRLVAYWDLIQPVPGTWDFANLDWQVEEAEKQNIPIIISIGQKAPRWPECHYPPWVDRENTQTREAQLLNYLQQVVERYKARSNIRYWQVENEPFLKLVMIDCPKTSYRFVQKEINLVKQLDPSHPVLLTDSGQVGTWYKAARLGDALGVTYYLKVHNSKLGYYRYPYLPGRMTLARLLSRKPDQSMMIIEQQAEPWSNKQIYELPLDQQISLFSLDELKESINNGRQLGLSAQYLWGAEWWYFLKQQGHPEYWNLVRTYIDARNGTLAFPPGFLWGASTASYQVEGGITNDWSEWEPAQATRLAAEASAHFATDVPNKAVWQEATIPENYQAGLASDHFRQFKGDFTIAESLGMNAQRISLEWARIEPREGQFDEAAMHHYQEVIHDLKAKGMEPFVTLWHYTLPLWFQEKGGWQSSTAIDDYNRYVQKTVETLGSDVKYWITMNEPGIYTSNAYYLGIRPPQQKSLLAYWSVLHTLIDAHKKVYITIKSINPAANVGIAHDVYSFEAKNNTWYNRPIVGLARWWRNFYVPNKLQPYQDFIGVNYYIHVPIGLGLDKKTWEVSDLGWKLNPKGISQALTDMKKYNKPIYITENGLADAADTYRSQYINEVLRYVHQAINDGVNVQGYFHWSLLDNFEWEKGKWPRFGLIEIDYHTQSRKIRQSALDYAEIIKKNAIITSD